MNKHLCRLHYYFSGVDSSYNDVMLRIISKYILNTISIQSVLDYYFITLLKCYM